MVARLGEVYWQVNPMYADTNGMTGHLSPNVFDFAVPLTMVAIWVAAFFINWPSARSSLSIIT